jgi:iron only hydrogenase large subunit-like protein
MNWFHSVTLDEKKCRGCTTCIKRCPTEAIRVKKGRAWIIDERCIDCGECVRVCPYQAKKGYSDPLSLLQEYDFRVAIPAPALYGQFPETVSTNKILTTLKYLGFDEVFEVARAADIVTAETKRLLAAGELPRPAISSSCPVIVRLIQNRFPDLIEHIIPMLSPMEISARIIKEKFANHPGRVGVFFISPCAAKVTAVRTPRGFEKSAVDGVIGIRDIWLLMNNLMKKITVEEDLAVASRSGISWARASGEGEAAGRTDFLSVDGISQVIPVLEEMEDGKLAEISFIEMMSCPGGCVGGPLSVENPYLAKTRINQRPDGGRSFLQEDLKILPPGSLLWDKPVLPGQALKLDPDFEKAVRMMEEMETIERDLPGLDCGSCGSPTCHSLAEDVVRGKARETDCAFKLRERLRVLTEEMIELEDMMPPGLDKEK